MQIDLAMFRATFVTEAVEHIEQLELGLLALEDRPGDLSPIHAIFRAAHSLKGSSATVGFEQVARFTHTLETVLGKIREGSLPVTRERINALLASVDVVRALLDCDQRGEVAPAEAEALRVRLEQHLDPPEHSIAALSTSDGEGDALTAKLAEGTVEARSCTVSSGLAGGPPPESARRLRLELVAHEGFFSTGLDPAILFRDLRELAEVHELTADLAEVPALQALAPEECFIRWNVKLSTRRTDDELRDVFMFVDGFCHIEIISDDDGFVNEDDVFPSESADSSELSAPAAADLAEAGALGPSGAAEERATPPAETVPASTATEPLSTLSTTRARATGTTSASTVDNSTLRVSTRKVDQLIDLVGELVIAQSMVKEIAAHFTAGRASALQDAVSLVERNLQELQHRVLGIRMVPFATVSARFPRVVRDAAERLGKRVTLRVEGEDTEVDKSIVERLADPLTHLLRNAVGHGVETPSERLASGKSETGELRLSARHETGGLVVECSDDGRGLDTAKIRARAEAVGLIRPDQELSDEQIQSMIFHPGFSTVTEVNDICGRGVGLDVVRDGVDALNGTLTFHTSPGRGTTFVVRLPLTLAILDGLLLQVGPQCMVIPVIAVTEFLRPKKAQVQSLAGERVLLLRGETLPIVRLADVFDIEGAQGDPCAGLVLVIDNDGRRFGLMVDGLTGQSQVVLKSLEANYRRIEGVLGATILGDGGIALIIDVAGLTRKTMSKRLPALVAA